MLSINIARQWSASVTMMKRGGNRVMAFDGATDRKVWVILAILLRAEIERWRREFNEGRLKKALGGIHLPPMQSS